jgi:hypothetical protein
VFFLPRINESESMTENDLLIRLLQSADAAAVVPPSRDDLANRVRRRRAATVARINRLKLGGLACAAGTAVVLVMVAIHSWQPPAPPGAVGQADNRSALHPPAEPGASRPVVDIAKLRAEADALGAEADALEIWIAAKHRSERLQELTDEHDQLLIAQCEPDPIAAACDRAAGNLVWQGDFLWETFGARAAAENAYRSVVEHFPETRWASVAEDNLARLSMN